MTLSIMEDNDTFKTALINFGNGVGDIPKVLERYLGYVAKTGKPLFSWEVIVHLITKKFEIACEEYVSDDYMSKIRAQVDDKSVEDWKKDCLKAINCHTGVPFTIQRICELLLTPRKNYSRLDKFLRGFFKVINVVTTINCIGQKMTTESQPFSLSPLQTKEMVGNCQGFTAESNSFIQHNNLIKDSINITDNKSDNDYEDKSIDETLTNDSETLSSYGNDNHQQSTQPNIYSSDQYYIEQKTIPMPHIGALFKPIDQLEAFVQNVSSQVESSIVIKEVSKKRLSCVIRCGIDALSPDTKRQKVVDTASTSGNNIPLTSESLPAESSESIICAEEIKSTSDISGHSLLLDIDIKDNSLLLDVDIKDNSLLLDVDIKDNSLLLDPEIKKFECSHNDVGEVEIIESPEVVSEPFGNMKDVISKENVTESESIVENILDKMNPSPKDMVDCYVNIVKLDILTESDKIKDEDVVESGMDNTLAEVEAVITQFKNSDDNSEIGISMNIKDAFVEFRDIPGLESKELCKESDLDKGKDVQKNSGVVGAVVNIEINSNVVISPEAAYKHEQSNEGGRG